MKIIWNIDHDYSANAFLLIGDYKNQRFVKGVYNGFWGLPLKYAKWRIERNFKILYPPN